MSKKIMAVLGGAVALLLAFAILAAYTGIGYASPEQAAAPVTAQTEVTIDPIEAESCVTCHGDAGAKHQASYDELYQDGAIRVTDLAYSFTAPDTTEVTFKMTKNGLPFDARQADSLAIYFAPWTGTQFQFEPAAERLNLKGDVACDASGACTSTLVGEAPDLANEPGLVVLYGRDEDMGRLPARVYQTKYPFAALLETGAGVDYVSAANNAGCEKCHTTPYLKHGYIYGQVDHDAATDFYTCKACHLDNNPGEHVEWQLLVEDPELAAAFLAGEAELTPEQEEQYAYNPSLMNDVHMSHAMEFPYPQSMSSCVTCHEGKLDVVLADANFRGEVCKSCHPVNGAVEAVEGEEEPSYDTTELALVNLMPASVHEDMDLNTEDCAACHAEGEAASTFRDIHSGYDDMIYTADGVRYSDVVTVTVDNATLTGDELTIEFSAVSDLEDVDPAAITPTVLVGLYGYDTKDYIVGPHERLTDDNNDGEISSASGDSRALEFEVGEEHPRMATVSAEDGKWEVTADLSQWADLIAAGTVKRVEIGVIPTLTDADGMILALNAPSRTFDLGAKEFADDFYAPIVKIEDGCETCHDALATNYHTPDRGGNIVVCRLCHITKSGGSHLEMQSRSIDSYAHAIHSGQAFDIADIDFEDPVEAMHYQHHIEFPYPMHGATNCESCHVPDTNDVPDQTRSLPGILSASEEVTGWDRNIGEVPSVITGPAARACGGCHKAVIINEDNIGEFVPFDLHITHGGYMVEAGDDPIAALNAVIEQIVAIFD